MSVDETGGGMIIPICRRCNAEIRFIPYYILMENSEYDEGLVGDYRCRTCEPLCSHLVFEEVERTRTTIEPRLVPSEAPESPQSPSEAPDGC